MQCLATQLRGGGLVCTVQISTLCRYCVDNIYHRMQGPAPPSSSQAAEHITINCVRRLLSADCARAGRDNILSTSRLVLCSAPPSVPQPVFTITDRTQFHVYLPGVNAPQFVFCGALCGAAAVHTDRPPECCSFVKKTSTETESWFRNIDRTRPKDFYIDAGENT